ncbi:protein TIPIN homolog [Nylanderia fulva]|nr:protein TIPIN homolog [Nylanderia fulva]
MPGTPMEQDNNVLGKLQSERSPDEPKNESVVREITQTDRLNKKLLVSVLERMKKSDGQFDKFMEDERGNCESHDDSDFYTLYTIMTDIPDYEGDDDIVDYYENKESDDERGSLGVAEEATSDNEGESARRIDPSKPKSHTVRKPIPKLNTERLKGANGIHTIEKYFEGFKFYGKGHEKTDLDRIMKRLEHWSYRLFPKYHFDDFLTRVEQLGKKKDLQVFIKRYRLNMVSSDDNLIIDDNVDDEEDQQESAPLDDFDLLITEQIQKQKQAEARASTPAAPSTSNEDAFDLLLTQSNNISNSQAPEPASTAKDDLSTEMKERIERNKQLAIQRRLQRQKEREEEESKKMKLVESTNIETLNENNNPTVHNEIDASQVDSTGSQINENENEAIGGKLEEVLSSEKPITDDI